MFKQAESVGAITVMLVAFTPVGSLAGGQAPVTPPVAAPNPLVQAVRNAFTARNPLVTRVTILELRSTAMGSGPYVLLARGIRPDMTFQGRFDDELFGLFLVDRDLTRIERTVEIFPTRRWADYIVSIEKLTDSEVTVVGQGSYGDQKFRRVYSLTPPG